MRECCGGRSCSVVLRTPTARTRTHDGNGGEAPKLRVGGGDCGLADVRREGHLYEVLFKGHVLYNGHRVVCPL
jgi:hypothetical protein